MRGNAVDQKRPRWTFVGCKFWSKQLGTTVPYCSSVPPTMLNTSGSRTGRLLERRVETFHRTYGGHGQIRHAAGDLLAQVVLRREIKTTSQNTLNTRQARTA